MLNPNSFFVLKLGFELKRRISKRNQFIETEKLPNVFFTTILKTRLIEKIKYDGHKDVFLDCTSKLLPIVSKFIQFWNENIESNVDDIDNNNMDNSSSIISDNDNEELEIDELCCLFTYHMKTNINEKTILDLIISLDHT